MELKGFKRLRNRVPDEEIETYKGKICVLDSKRERGFPRKQLSRLSR